MNWKNGETETGTFAKYLCYCYDRKLRCFTHVAILQPCWALCSQVPQPLLQPLLSSQLGNLTRHYVIQTRQKGDDAGDIENRTCLTSHDCDNEGSGGWEFEDDAQGQGGYDHQALLH